MFYFVFLFFFLFDFLIDGKLTIDIHADLLERSDLSRATVNRSGYMDLYNVHALATSPRLVRSMYVLSD